VAEVLTLLLVGAAHAGELTDEATLFEAIPSVSGASKYEQRADQAPASVTIITADEISRHGWTTLAEALMSVRGLLVSDDFIYSFLGVRGFARPGDYTTRVLLLIDGMRINDNLYSQAISDGTVPIDMGSVQRIEIIRGPGSALYGTSAMLGVINIITRSGRDLRGVEVEALGGSHGTARGRVAWGNELRGGTEVLVALQGHHRTGRDVYFDDFDTPPMNDGVAEDLNGEDYASALLKVERGDFTVEAMAGARRVAYPTAPWETQFNDPRSQIVDTSTNLGLSWDRASPEGGQSHASLHLHDYRNIGDYPFDYASYWPRVPAQEPDVVLNRDQSRGVWVVGEANHTTRALRGHRITWGAETQVDLIQYQSNFDVPDDYLYFEDSRSGYWLAAFAQDAWSPVPALTIHVGGRLDYHPSFSPALSPRAGVLVNPFEGGTFKLLYGTAFRAPNAYERYYHDGNFTTKAAETLDPETITTYEVIWEQQLGPNVRGTASGFHYFMEDLLEYTTDPTDGLLVYENRDQVVAYGAEGDLYIRIDPRLDATMSWAWQQATDSDTGEWLTNSPQHLGKLSAGLGLIPQRLELLPEMQYIGPRLTRSGVTLDPALLLHLGLQSREMLPRTKFTAQMRNILDRPYISPASAEHIQDTLSGDGRTWRLSAQVRF